MKQKILTGLGWVLFLLLMTGVCYKSNPTISKGGESVRVICMNTKEDADATLIYHEGAAVMIDTGTKEDAEHIMEMLKRCNVGKLDYMILSHGDSDHIGGAAQLLESIPVTYVVESGYEKADEEMEELNRLLEQKGIPVLYPVHTQHLRAGEIQLLVYPPLEKNYRDSNNYSLAVLAKHGNVNMMFAGDALKKRTEELLLIDWPKIDLYKVAHHGRGNVMTEELFDRLKPEYAVVTANQADEQILRAAERNGAAVFYTGERDVIFQSDGKKLNVED